MLAAALDPVAALRPRDVGDELRRLYRLALPGGALLAAGARIAATAERVASWDAAELRASTGHQGTTVYRWADAPPGWRAPFEESPADLSPDYEDPATRLLAWAALGEALVPGCRGALVVDGEVIVAGPRGTEAHPLPRVADEEVAVVLLLATLRAEVEAVRHGAIPFPRR